MFNPLNVVILESNHLDTQIVNQETLTNTNKFYHIKVLKRDQIVEMLRVWLNFDNGQRANQRREEWQERGAASRLATEVFCRSLAQGICLCICLDGLLLRFT